MKAGRAVLTIAVAAWVLMAVPTIAAASTYEVTTNEDPDPPAQCTRDDCSLREAILRANSHDGADKVVLEGGSVYDIEIAGGGEDGGLTGDLDSTGPLSVIASGPGRATVDGHDLTGGLDIQNDVRPEPIV